MKDFSCPHCGAHSTLQSVNMENSSIPIILDTAKDHEGIKLQWVAIKCPSPKCGKFTFDVESLFGTIGPDRHGNARQVVSLSKIDPQPVGLGYVRFLPRVGKPLSCHVPDAVNEDYEEACTIKDLSPKAAATLCRRALQGMVRDFWKVSAKTLHRELELIEDKCDTDLYTALMGIKSIGNIGAHPEMDISVIIDVDEGEVDALIQVLQILDNDWYVSRAEKAKRLAVVQALGASKAVQKASNAAASPAPQSGP